VIVGDANLSEISTFLKVGTTAIVLSMIEDDWFGDVDFSLAAPVQAIRRVSYDVGLGLRLELRDGRRIALVDPRALATVTLHRDATAALPALGPEPHDTSLDVAYLRGRLAKRRGAIKPTLLDQGLIAGLGNIYAAEALWRARIDPRARAASLSVGRLERLLAAIRETIRIAREEPRRYSSDDAPEFAVYDREGEPCLRCGAPIRRIVQAGRSTYFCPVCQRR